MKRRRLKPWAATLVRVVRATAITMMVLILAIMCSYVLYLNYIDTVEWRDVGFMLAGLLPWGFWSWLYSVAEDLLQYA